MEINSGGEFRGRRRCGIGLCTTPGATAAKGWPRPHLHPSTINSRTFYPDQVSARSFVNHVQSICTPLGLIIPPIMCCFGNIKTDSSRIYELHKLLSGARVKGSNASKSTANKHNRKLVFLLHVFAFVPSTVDQLKWPSLW